MYPNLWGPAQFHPPVLVGRYDAHTSRMDEPSGLGASRIHANIIYSHDDENDDVEVYAIDTRTARVVATFPIKHANNIDWEDLSVGRCGLHDNRSCIYINDDGSTGHHHHTAVVYKIVEPSHMSSHVLYVLSAMEYRWSESESNTVMVDPTGEVYIISSRTNGHIARVAKLPRSSWGNSHYAGPVFVQPFGIRPIEKGPDGADISPDGTEIIVAMERRLYYYWVPLRNYFELLSHPGVQLPPIGGTVHNLGVCWSADGRSVFVIDEQSYKVFRFDKL